MGHDLVTSNKAHDWILWGNDKWLLRFLKRLADSINKITIRSLNSIPFHPPPLLDKLQSNLPPTRKEGSWILISPLCPLPFPFRLLLLRSQIEATEKWVSCSNTGWASTSSRPRMRGWFVPCWPSSWPSFCSTSSDVCRRRMELIPWSVLPLASSSLPELWWVQEDRTVCWLIEMDPILTWFSCPNNRLHVDCLGQEVPTHKNTDRMDQTGSGGGRCLVVIRLSASASQSVTPSVF